MLDSHNVTRYLPRAVVVNVSADPLRARQFDKQNIIITRVRAFRTTKNESNTTTHHVHPRHFAMTRRCTVYVLQVFLRCKVFARDQYFYDVLQNAGNPTVLSLTKVHSAAVVR